ITMTQDAQYAYKFVDSSATPQWITDPVNRRFEYGPFGSNSLFNTDATTDTSTLEQHDEFSATKLQNKRKLIVYLPPNYRSAKTRYPVLYMHDGQNLFDDQAIWGGWGVKNWADQMIKAGQLKPFIVVGVENTIGRMDEYTHTTDKISGTSAGGKANDYADFLLKDIKPYIDGLYRTQPDHRHTAVMGSSLGGLISLWLGVHYPRTFFRIGALSSTFGWGKIGANNPTLGEIFQTKGFQNLVVYIDSGSPQDNYQVTLQMRDTMRQLGYLDDLNLLHYVEPNAIHNEKAWRDRLHRPLSFLLSWP
ncbi:MAG: alpha/beta hydrolase, partial [Hyphomonadaceae bacterium]|nr:alpha/beta hydrolase [Hyphomonadaceae bacterium]